MNRIQTIRVSAGIYWVDIPEAGLRILCGCPADSVKHLFRRGLIVEQIVDGVRCETGPNAILLSDTMLQNGDFANLAEFPVLQMLYRQGMGIPKHPNNKGVKPLLIGLSNQVHAQMEYIYRGNYGLISREEMLDVGVPEHIADERMREKLRFAFGAIRPSSDIVDFRVVGASSIEIRNDVWIHREGLNVFDITYKGESTTIDLNLPPDEHYESPYPLGYRAVRRDYFAIVHSGEADGWDHLRPSVSSVVLFQGRVYLVDAGPNLVENMRALGIGINEIAGIFQTHAHDDHFAGITALLRSGNRIPFYATPLVRSSVAKKMSVLVSMDEERFHEFFDVRDLVENEWNNVDGMDVRPVPSPHPVETTVFFFRVLWANGYRTYAHLVDIPSLTVLERMIADEGPGITREAFENVQETLSVVADVKKIDVGGSMIHGDAKDFVDDLSPRILLCHIARELTPEETAIGSSAPHGSVDVLVPAHRDFMRRRAEEHLTANLPGITIAEIDLFLNHDIIDINPGVVLAKAQAHVDTVYLVLSGVVERIGEFSQWEHSIGTIIGDLNALTGTPTPVTYRTRTYVRAVAIPATLFRSVVQRSRLVERIVQHAEVVNTLRSTRLFGEAVSDSRLGQIAELTEVIHLPEGAVLRSEECDALCIVASGTMRRNVGEEILDVLLPNDYFGEEHAVFQMPCLYTVEAFDDVVLYRIPGNEVADIPIVRWTLFESYMDRMTTILHIGGDVRGIVWRDEFTVFDEDMDRDHAQMLAMANETFDLIVADSHPREVAASLLKLEDYATRHFEAEEALVSEVAPSQTELHVQKHRRLLNDLTKSREQLLRQTSLSETDISGFLERWIIRHVLGDDRIYVPLMREKNDSDNPAA